MREGVVAPSSGFLRGPLPRGQDPPSVAETAILPRKRSMGSRRFAGDPTLLPFRMCVHLFVNILYLSSTLLHVRNPHCCMFENCTQSNAVKIALEHQLSRMREAATISKVHCHNTTSCARRDWCTPKIRPMLQLNFPSRLQHRQVT